VVEENSNMLLGSEFTDLDGRLYRVTSMHATHIVATCFYPCRDNDLIGCEKSFDMQLAKELIERRLNGYLVYYLIHIHHIPAILLAFCSYEALGFPLHIDGLLLH
jgi:hypothetical protein